MNIREKIDKLRKDTHQNKNERLIVLKSKNGDFHRYGKLVKEFKHTDSKYKYKVRIAPRTYIYTEKFFEEELEGNS